MAPKERLCRTHNFRRKKYGDPLVGEWDRFWFDVDADGDCWIWTGNHQDRGYGEFEGNRAHRWAWESLVGPVGDGLHLDHLCRNPPCVNPDHLEPVPGRINYLRGYSPAAQNARKTHCVRGHELAGSNLRLQRGKSGTIRVCRACVTIAESRRAQRRGDFDLAVAAHLADLANQLNVPVGTGRRALKFAVMANFPQQRHSEYMWGEAVRIRKGGSSR